MNNSNIKKMIAGYPDANISEKTKIREILQQTALLGLERHAFFEKAAFYGGTSLRILYGLDRFSEDMDFTLLKPDPKFDFQPFLEGMQKELSSFGFQLEVLQKTKNIQTSVLSAFLKMNTIQLYLSIGEENKAKSINHNEKIQIKIEVDTDPPTGFRVESHLVLNPVSFYILTLHKSDLFAGKMHAILYRAWKGRVKGRDWYDLIWYVQNKISLNIHFLEINMKKEGHLPLEEKLDRNRLIHMIHEKIDSINWESAKDDMRTFIADPQRLNIWSPKYFKDLIQHIQVE